MPNNMKTYDGTGDPEDHVKIFEAVAQQKKYVKDPVEIHNIKQRDGETIEDFMELFKVETGRMKGAPESTTAFIRGETVAASKKKGHTSWKPHDQPKRHVSKWKYDFRVTIRSTILIPTKCATMTISSKEILKEAEVHHENSKVALHLNFPNHKVAIGGTLSVKGRMQLCSLLKENLDKLRMQSSPPPRHDVSTTISSEHRSSIQEGYSSVLTEEKGPRSRRNMPTSSASGGHETVEAGIMREVYYDDWLSNPVMVKKHDGSWRMCVDFTDLNKACPQDCFPLPEIDWKVESLCGYPFKCFLDAYKGYHQIQMAELDEENTAFHTSHGVYCYSKMPFGLKNAGATYQRLVDKAFNNQVGRNIEVYVDDLIIKSHTEIDMLRDMDETFPRRDKTEARQDISCATTPFPMDISKEVNSPNGKLAKLNRFHSNLSGKSEHLTEATHSCSDPNRMEYDCIHVRPAHGANVWVLNDTERGTFKLPFYFVKPRIARPERKTIPIEKRSPKTALFVAAEEFTASNNKAKYEALIVGLRITAQMGVRNVHVSVDSKLVVNQVPGTYVAKEENMIKYLEKAKSLVSGFANFSISQVPRCKNKKADALSKIGQPALRTYQKRSLLGIRNS
ncbi:reverse transcriptase domain-containing protein [Tanacetum coccineum]